jgi:putative nucleotidyltransferase with HDIG domain
MRINPTKTIDELIATLSFIIDIEENKKLYHGWRVAVIACQLAERLKPKNKKEIFYAALLHDVGAVGLIKHITYFLKQENKTNQMILLSHPIIGAQLVSMIPRMNPEAKLILDHHEWFNGFGYPRGKVFRNIPLGAQLIRLADSIDIALRDNRYRNLKALQRRILELSNKEIPNNIYKTAINVLKKDNFFKKVLDLNNGIAEIFYEMKEPVGRIHMPKGTDCIGKALEVIAQIIDMKHPYTAGHSLRVSRYAMACALALKLNHDEVTRIKWAGLIHDIGKLTVPRKILDKPTKLTKAEFMHIKKHAEVTYKILNLIPSLEEIIPIASSHHEYFNGSGYPLGLKAHESVLGARILTLCDAFDAMTSNRPYRAPMSPEAACREIEKHAGSQFDPEIVKQTLPLFRNLGL